MTKTKYQHFKAQALRNPKIRRSYEEGIEDLHIAVRLAEMREKQGLSQTELAARIHSSPAVISRLERGHNVEFKTLKKVAAALGARLTVEAMQT